MKKYVLAFLALALQSSVVLAATQTITLTDPVSKSVTTYSFPSDYTALCTPACSNLSADGTTSAAPHGAPLVTASATWSWGAADTNNAGSYYLLLNGQTAPTYSSGVLMEVAHGGNFYVKAGDNSWWLWSNNAWAGSAAP
jgi:hypothetical protein